MVDVFPLHIPKYCLKLLSSFHNQDSLCASVCVCVSMCVCVWRLQQRDGERVTQKKMVCILSLVLRFGNQKLSFQISKLAFQKRSKKQLRSFLPHNAIYVNFYEKGKKLKNPPNFNALSSNQFIHLHFSLHFCSVSQVTTFRTN